MRRRFTSGFGARAFLPSKHQGVSLRSQGDPVLYLSDPKGVTPEIRRAMLDGVNALNQRHYETLGDPETHTRISQYEMAFRMQSSVPELTDLSSEPDYIFDLYGPDSRKPGTFATTVCSRDAWRSVGCAARRCSFAAGISTAT